MDIFENYSYKGTIDVKGYADAIDNEGGIYFAEEENFPEIVRYQIEIR
ncbi:MAG: hypothetical protein AB1410_09990 [Acidobacteriota bacterium]